MMFGGLTSRLIIVHLPRLPKVTPLFDEKPTEHAENSANQMATAIAKVQFTNQANSARMGLLSEKPTVWTTEGLKKFGKSGFYAAVDFVTYVYF